MTPASQENLKPVQPGEVRNPNGRPVGILDLKTRLNLGLSQLALEFAEAHNLKYKDQIKAKKRAAMVGEEVDIMGDVFRQYINMARNGNLKAIDSLLDRAYGKATAKLEVSGDPEHPIHHKYEMTEVEAEVESWVEGWLNPTKKLKVSVKKKAHGNNQTDTGAE